MCKKRLILIAFCFIFIIFCVVLGIGILFKEEIQATIKTLSVKVSNYDNNIKKLEISSGLFYDNENVTAINKNIEKLKKKTSYTFSNPLMIYNPFGLYNNSIYIYFNTDFNSKLRYTIKSDNTSDFTQTLKTDNGSYVTEHEYTIIGLIPNANNTVILELLDENDNVIEKKEFEVMTEPLSAEFTVTKQVIDESEELSDGLYFVTGGSGGGNNYLVDNDGNIRAELSCINYRSDNIKFLDGNIIICVNDRKLAMVDRVGRISKLYDLGDYCMHHDFDIVENKAIILASEMYPQDKEVENIVLQLDLDTSEVSVLFDFEEILGEYKKITNKAVDYTQEETWDWMHINTIDYIEDDQIVVSSRETSSIIKISDVFENPTIDYIIADEKIWEDTPYSDLVLTKESDFISQAGQHTVTYEEDENTEDGKYYIYLYNNNFWSYNTRENFEYRIEGTGDYDTENISSTYYKYLVDEENKTYDLVETIDVDYSPIMSSAKDYDDHYVICSSMANTFVEYDDNQNLLAKFTITNNAYRTFKLSFNGHMFE